MANNAVANNWVPDYYISGAQWSRLYALAYLDLRLRGPQGHSGYAESTKQYLSEVKAAALDSDKQFTQWLVRHVADYVGLVKDITQYNEKFFPVIRFNAQQLDCSLAQGTDQGTFKRSLEFNPYWAGTNSFFYICHIHGIHEKVSEQDKTLRMRHAFRNMLFIKPVKIDPPPSSLDGYDHQVIHDIVLPGDAASPAITLPSNATCC